MNDLTLLMLLASFMVGLAIATGIQALFTYNRNKKWKS